MTDVFRFYFGHINVFDCPSTVHGAFQPQHGGGADCFQIISQYIPYATGSFASAGDKSGTFAGDAIAYDHIFRRKVHPQSVCIPSRFDTDIIIVTVYIAVFDQDIAGRINVDTVRARTVSTYIVVDGQSVYRAIIGVKNLTSPKTGTHQGKSFQCNVRATFYEDAPYPFAVVIHNPAQSFCFVFFPHFPIFIPKYFSPAVQRSFSADGSVLFIDNVDNCRGPCHLDSCNPRTEFGIMMNGWAGQ